ncbi:MAG: winged helix-turn-helix transcriptional regulator [Alphaproteobacteria bacterium]|nr:winged helix-turn-helix transcriptional regulator [Alphaproteobacteria bacterium]
MRERAGGEQRTRNGGSVPGCARRARPHAMAAKPHEDVIIRDILDRIDGVENVTQRTLASELGIALGMANAYVRRCIAKGWIKVNQAPARRYRYYLTPKGFAEKSRLTAQYLSDGLKLFRRARQSYDCLYLTLRQAGVRRVVLCGYDDLTEIAILSSITAEIDVIGIWSPTGAAAGVRGIPVVTLDEALRADRLVIASTRDSRKLLGELRRRVAPERIALPDLLTNMTTHKARPQAAE